MTPEGWLRDLVLRAIVASPLSPRDAAFLKEHLVGRPTRRGHFRLRVEKDDIAWTLDWAFLSILLNLGGDSECITLGLFAAGLLNLRGVSFSARALDPRAKGQLARRAQARGRGIYGGLSRDAFVM